MSYQRVDIRDDDAMFLSARDIKIDLSRSMSIDSNPDIEQPGHFRHQTSIGTKIQRIKSGTSKSQKDKRQKITKIRSCNDLWRWYMRHPIGHLPIFYFFISLFVSLFFVVYWFMDDDTSYVLCGIYGLSMMSYASYKFKTSIGLKEQVDHYKQLNHDFKKENKCLTDEVDRAKKAHQLLKTTRKRLRKINDKNRENIQKMEKVENNLKVAGEKQFKGMNEVYKHASEIRGKWRDEFLSNERQMLHAVFDRYEHQSTHSRLGMDKEDFVEFQKMLPKRYRQRFKRMGTFHVFSGGDSKIDFTEFSHALDTFAEMEVDQKDIDCTPSVSRAASLIADLSIDGFDDYSPQLHSMEYNDNNSLTINFSRSSSKHKFEKL